MWLDPWFYGIGAANETKKGIWGGDRSAVLVVIIADLTLKDAKKGNPIKKTLISPKNVHVESSWAREVDRAIKIQTSINNEERRRDAF